MKVLITGGCGYIGSVTARALEAAGHIPVIFDSLVTGQRAFAGEFAFSEGDIGDREAIRRVLQKHPDISAALHFAALVVAPESVARPETYYENNVARSMVLFEELATAGVTKVVFSSSAAVYASPDAAVEGFEVREDAPLSPASPYARSKLMTEQMLEDIGLAGGLTSVSLRYFNPIGAHPDGVVGLHGRKPSSVLGQLVRAATGQQDAFVITGVDLPTPDGTGVRDYVHVWDVANAHVQAVARFDEVLRAEGATSTVINIGTGRGTSVRELIAAFERASGLTVPVVEGPARPGDPAGSFANVDKAVQLLDWRSEHSVEDAIRSALSWDSRRSTVLGYR